MNFVPPSSVRMDPPDCVENSRPFTSEVSIVMEFGKRSGDVVRISLIEGEVSVEEEGFG